jgi:hypothetical protein
MPELCANHTYYRRDGYDANGVGVDLPAAKVAIEGQAGGDCREPEQDAEGSDRETANVNEWIHERLTFSSIEPPSFKVPQPLAAFDDMLVRDERACYFPCPQGSFQPAADC